MSVVPFAKENPDRASCKKLAQAGAVRIKWPEDLKHDEKESYTWTVLEPHRWDKEQHLGWRYAKPELQKIAAATSQKRQRREE